MIEISHQFTCDICGDTGIHMLSGHQCDPEVLGEEVLALRTQVDELKLERDEVQGKYELAAKDFKDVNHAWYEASEAIKALQAQVDETKKRASFWEDSSNSRQASSDYYQQQLTDAHALLGRVVQQASERWDTLNLTKHFPTGNLHRKRTVSNPSGGAG